MNNNLSLSLSFTDLDEDDVTLLLTYVSETYNIPVFII